MILIPEDKPLQIIEMERVVTAEGSVAYSRKPDDIDRIEAINDDVQAWRRRQQRRVNILIAVAVVGSALLLLLFLYAHTRSVPA